MSEKLLYSEKIKLSPSQFDLNDNLLPSAIFQIFQDVASVHGEMIGGGFEAMLNKGLYWVTVRTKYDVYVQKSQDVNGQIEARYLFNTAFMDRFMQIAISFGVYRVQCSIFDDSMLILLSTNKDLFEMNHLFGRIDDIHQYDHLFDEFASVLSFIDVLNLASKTGL